MKADGTDQGRGLIFVVSAPSGTGKTTLVREILKRVSGLRFSVSFTTRTPRANEQEGIDYHFVSPSVFQKMVDRGEFLEWAEVLGNRYGTAQVDGDALRSEGVDLILDIDTQGAKSVLEAHSDAVLIFILPPSPEVLEERLVRRGLDSAERIRFRLANAYREVSESHRYHYIILNGSMKQAVEELKAIILAERCRALKPSVLKEKMKEWEEYHGKNYSGRLSEKSGEPF